MFKVVEKLKSLKTNRKSILVGILLLAIGAGIGTATTIRPPVDPAKVSVCFEDKFVAAVSMTSSYAKAYSQKELREFMNQAELPADELALYKEALAYVFNKEVLASPVDPTAQAFTACLNKK